MRVIESSAVSRRWFNRSVSASAERRIDAPIETVWGVLSDIDRWPTWNSGVTSSALRGPLQAGTPFDWKSGVSLKSELVVVDEPFYLCWNGSAPGGIVALHSWTLSEQSDSTHVLTEEVFSGLLVRLWPNYFRRLISTSLEQFLQELDAVCRRKFEKYRSTVPVK